MAHGLSIAEDVGVQLKVGELSIAAMIEAKGVGEERGRSLDSSSVFEAVRQRAGLTFENDAVRARHKQDLSYP